MKYWAVSAFSYIGLSTVMWAIGRVFHYLTLLRKDEMYAKERPYKSDKRYKTLRILALVFYVLGNVVSLAIQGIDHLCHKRLYHVHLIAMKDLKKVTQEYFRELETYGDIPKARKHLNELEDKLHPTADERDLARLVAEVGIDVQSINKPGIDKNTVARLAEVYKENIPLYELEYCVPAVDQVQSLKDDYDDFCASYHVGPQDHYDPMDLPDWWDSLD